MRRVGRGGIRACGGGEPLDVRLTAVLIGPRWGHDGGCQRQYRFAASVAVVAS